MCVVSHGFCRLGGMGLMWRMVCMRDKANVVGRMSGDAGARPEYEVIQ